MHLPPFLPWLPIPLSLNIIMDEVGALDTASLKTSRRLPKIRYLDERKKDTLVQLGT